MTKELEDLQMFVASVRRMTTVQRMANAGKIADDAIEKVTAVVEGMERRIVALEGGQSLLASLLTDVHGMNSREIRAELVKKGVLDGSR